jgi:hypothetical protein
MHTLLRPEVGKTRVALDRGTRLSVTMMAALVAASALTAQCPDTGRTKIEKAGISAETMRQCATFSVTVLGLTIASAGTCRDSYVQRLDDEFACHGQAAPGFCCRMTGKARINIFGPTNTCPVPPAVMPQTLADATLALQCSEPRLQRQTFNWSAQDHDCASTPSCSRKAKKQSGEPRHNQDQVAYLGWWGNPDSRLPTADASTVAGWLAPLQDVLPGSLTAPMGDMWNAVAPLPVVSGIVADVAITNRLTDGSFKTFKFRVEGAAAADGRFSVASTTGVEGPNGEVVDMTADMSYDHRAFYVGSQGENFYSAYPRNLPSFTALLLASACEVVPVLDWVRGPAWIPRVSAATYSTDQAVINVNGVPTQVVRVAEQYPGSSLSGSREYDFDTYDGKLRLLRTASRDMTGALLIERTFSEHRAFAGGYRPFSMATTWYVPSSSEVSREVVLSVSEARMCAEADVRTWRRGSNVDKWYIIKPPAQ